MGLPELLGLYLVGGGACAFAARRRGGSWPSVLVSLFAWPVWAPVALTDRPDEPRRGAAGARFALLLGEAREAAAGTPFGTMLHEEAAARILREVDAATTRLAGLEAALRQPTFDRDGIVERIVGLEAEGAGEGALRPARLHLESVDRLLALRDRQRAALDELEQVLCALRGQLVVARYAGPEHDGVEGVLRDLWSRVEGLGEVLEDEDPERGRVIHVASTRAWERAG